MDSDLFITEEPKAAGQIILANVTAINGNQAKLQIDGVSINRFYKVMYTGAAIAAGDRVLAVKISGTYVVLGKI